MGIWILLHLVLKSCKNSLMLHFIAKCIFFSGYLLSNVTLAKMDESHITNPSYSWINSSWLGSASIATLSPWLWVHGCGTSGQLENSSTSLSGLGRETWGDGNRDGWGSVKSFSCMVTPGKLCILQPRNSWTPQTVAQNSWTQQHKRNH